MGLGPVMLDVLGKQLTAEDEARLRHPLVGGVILFARNYESPGQLIELTTALRARRAPPLLISVDHEGGRVQRFRDGFTRIPAMRELGKIWDKNPRHARQLAEEAGWVLAAELLEHGGMAAVGKHFPGHGHVAADSHTEIPMDERLFSKIEEEDLEPFRRMIDFGMVAVMPAHVIYPKVDGKPAGFSRIWLQQVLHEDPEFMRAVHQVASIGIVEGDLQLGQL